MTTRGNYFICEVILPSHSPIRSVIGQECTRKSIAKRSAAFEACLQLRKGQYLDANLLPIYAKHLPAMRNALLALDLKKTNMYDMLTKPNVWKEGRDTIPDKLYVTVLDLSVQMDMPHQPLGFLTRKPLPQFPSFPLYLNTGTLTWATSIPLKSSITTPADVLKQVTIYTLRIFLDLFNKTYEDDVTKMSYWLIPLRIDIAYSSDSRPSDLLDWKAVRTVCENEEYKWTSETASSFLVDKFLIDPWDGGRRYFSTGIHPTYKATDPVPQDAVKEKHMKNILDYSISLFKSSRAKFAHAWDLNQPVMVAKKVLHRRNLLAEADTKERAMRSIAYLCPEPLKISAVGFHDNCFGLLLTQISFRPELLQSR